MKVAPAAARATAIVIAIAAAIDPAWTSRRSTRPDVSIVAATEHDIALADRVGAALADRFTVVRAPFAGAAGTVIAGDRLPPHPGAMAAPIFAVTAAAPSPGVRLVSVSHPPSAPLDARVPVAVRTHVAGVAGRKLTVRLAVGGLTIDEVSTDITDVDTAIETRLSFVPASTGTTAARVTASVAGTAHTSSADIVVDVRERRWSVLFFDRRASWQSTFVRRLIERDARFDVASRVFTSGSVSADAGGPPASLADPAALESFDVIVVGAPEALDPRDVAGLERFLRDRGGTVVFLPDQPPAGAWLRLVGSPRWASASPAVPVHVRMTDGDSAGLAAMNLAWPITLPAGATSLASDSAADSPVRSQAVLWQAPVGAGRAIVSGALDSWRFRDAAVSSFDVFWPARIGEAANGSLPPVDIVLSQSVVRPGEFVEIDVTVRSAALADPGAGAVRATAGAVLEGPGTGSRIRLWPDGAGRFTGTVRAPSTAGDYRIVVAVPGNTQDVPLRVDAATSRPQPAETDLVAAWAGSHGGMRVDAGRLPELVASLEAALSPETRAETTHPMRSPWWIVPFALLLAGEWWWRRRRGLT